MGCSASQFDKKVVIVGAGYVGTEAAVALDAHFDVTVVEPQDAMHHKIGALRAAVVPGWENRLRVPLDKMLKRGRLVRGEVSRVEINTVTLKSGEVFDADYIILAHGQGAMLFPAGPLPNVTDSAALKAAAVQKQGQVSRAQSILIVGGGPVGVEMAGEIKSQYPNKKVTLVHSHSALLSNSTPKIIPTVTDQLATLLRAKGVQLRLDVKTAERLSPTVDGDSFVEGQQTVHLSDGSSVDADLAIIATGAPKRDSNIVDAVDELNRVKVDEYLRVEGFQNVFCVGDANNHPETKLAFTGGNQAKHLCKNLIAAAGDKPAKVVPYKGIDADNAEYGAMFVPVGPDGGVSAVGTTVIGGWLTAKIKSKGLFGAQYHKKLNYSLPAIVPAGGV